MKNGFALSKDLPLISSTFLPRERETATGAVDDARPDRWGERVIRFLDKPPRLAVLDYLYFAGDERFGALGVSTSRDEYRLRSIGPLPRINQEEEISRLVQQILAGEPVPEEQRRLIAPGVTLGGARPKALLNIGGAQWVAKFNEPGEPIDMPLVEHATMTLAQKAGIRVAETRAIPLHRGHAVAVKRFDRVADGRRLHAISANVALKAADEELGYPQLAQLLRRRGVPSHDAMHELYRRMAFNVLIDNTDDHGENHALLANDAGLYELSPAFDVLPSAQGLGYQAMIVGSDLADSTVDNVLSQSTSSDWRAQSTPATKSEESAAWWTAGTITSPLLALSGAIRRCNSTSARLPRQVGLIRLRARPGLG